MTDPATWSPEQTEAALALAIEHNAPSWAEKLALVEITAREAAPEGKADAWADAARAAFLRQVGVVGDRMAAHVFATPEQSTRFAHAILAAIQARYAELKAGSVQQGGRA